MVGSMHNFAIFSPVLVTLKFFSVEFKWETMVFNVTKIRDWYTVYFNYEITTGPGYTWPKRHICYSRYGHYQVDKLDSVGVECYPRCTNALVE